MLLDFMQKLTAQQRKGKHRCNKTPKARKHTYHSGITGWLKTSDEGKFMKKENK